MSSTGRPHRWLVLSVFVLSTAINYLDRQTLATLAPLLRVEFHLSNTDYGLILTAFSVTYAASAPFAGWLIDTIGLNRAVSLAVAVWSCSGIWTGFTTGLAGLTGCRAVLGLAESAGIPSAGKAIHQYLLPNERALGNALNQAGVSLGLVLAPPIAISIAVAHGWRNAFVITGLLGLLWIPLWNAVAARFGSIAAPANTDPHESGAEILRHPRLWVFVAANALSMTGYSLWTNWTTTYLVDAHHLTLAQAAWYAWIPPLFATIGGVAGGWFSQYLMRRGVEAVAARTRACAVSSVAALASALVPVMPGPAWASAGISLSIFALAAFSVNMYTMPLDTFGGARAAFAVSILVASYGGVQALVSPAFGAIIDARGYTPVCLLVSFLPLAAYGILKWTEAPVQ